MLPNLYQMDSVKIDGLAHSLEEKEMIEKIVKGIKGIKKISNKLRFLKASMSGV
jgi:osmotically-inducible protein OsmY